MVPDIAEKLRNLRENRGLSQKNVADRIHISPSIISAYEQGSRTPSIVALLKLSNLYGCSVDYLLGRDRNDPMTTLDVSGLGEAQIAALQVIIDTMKRPE